MRAGSVDAFAPGRVNLVGEHTDYNAGLALPFAIARGVRVRATPLPGPLVMATARDLGETDTFDAWRPGTPGDVRGWRAFVRGTAAELAADDLPVPACRLEISGDVPRSGGLSSSAALGVSVALALLALAGAEDVDRRRVARVCSRVEQRWVGAPTGLLDQYASLLSGAGRALLIDFRDDWVELIPLQLGADLRLAVVPSGGRRDLASSAYADRRRECAEAAQRLGLPSLREAPPEAAEELPEPWRSRALHVIGEDRRVLAAADALREGDAKALGPVLDASHTSLRDLFHVSTENVERTVARCRAAGALGARLIGGGFGGYVLALLPVSATIPHAGFEVAPCAGASVS